MDIYINDNLVTSRLSYKQSTPYLTVPAGTYNVKIYPRGQTVNPLSSNNITLPPRAAFTVAAVGNPSEISLLLIPQPFVPQFRQTGQAYIRVINLSPSAPPIDIELADGTKLISDVEFKEISPYIPINPEIYALQATPVGSNQLILSLPRVNVQPNGVYTIFVVGEVDGTPPLDALLSVDTIG